MSPFLDILGDGAGVLRSSSPPPLAEFTEEDVDDSNCNEEISEFTKETSLTDSALQFSLLYQEFKKALENPSLDWIMTPLDSASTLVNRQVTESSQAQSVAESIFKETERLQQIVEQDEKEANDHDLVERAVRDAILKRVKSVLSKPLQDEQQLQEVSALWSSVWESVMKRPKGRDFLCQHIGQGCLTPSSLYIKALRWVWDDNLIELASRIENAPRASPNQSHKHHAKVIRTWLSNPANARSITVLARVHLYQ